MLPLVKTQGPRSLLDRSPKNDLASRVVQMALVIYLSPVILLVAIIGGVSLAAQVASRLVLKPDDNPGPRRVRIAFRARDVKSPVEGGTRGAHALH